jgi:hypothetical protein
VNNSASLPTAAPIEAQRVEIRIPRFMGISLYSEPATAWGRDEPAAAEHRVTGQVQHLEWDMTPLRHEEDRRGRTRRPQLPSGRCG